MNNESTTLEKHPLRLIPYQGKKEDHILASFKKGTRKMLSRDVKPRKTTFTGRKVSTSLQIKDRTEERQP